jgi:hypothetical protein
MCIRSFLWQPFASRTRAQLLTDSVSTAALPPSDGIAVRAAAARESRQFKKRVKNAPCFLEIEKLRN